MTVRLGYMRIIYNLQYYWLKRSFIVCLNHLMVVVEIIGQTVQGQLLIIDRINLEEVKSVAITSNDD